MRKKILFPVFNRVHEARQKLLLEELSKDFQVCITTYGEKDLDMARVAVDIAGKFQNALDKIKPDIALIRGDRYEMLVPAMLCAYNKIPIAHIEGFDLSGAIDNKVRYAISYLSDLHLVTNEESYRRALSMGFKNVYNYGSLDVEYAIKCSQTLKNAPERTKEYLVVLYHPYEKEDVLELYRALEDFIDYDIIGIKSNKDYGKQTYKEEYTPEEFINLLRGAELLIGNSSAGIKEAPALGINVVNIGERQANRLRPDSVKDCKCEEEDIKYSIRYQLEHSYLPSKIYCQKDTSKKIAKTISSFL